MTTHHAHAHAPQPTPWNFTAAIAAWLLPGLGHYLLGQHRRGGILAATIGVLWLAGLVIGGIGTFDRSQMAISIVQYGQYGLGPSIVLHYAHRHMRASGDADGNPRYEPAFGRVQEQAVLYTALAGMLNLLAVMDVMYRDPRKPHPIVDGHLHPDTPHPHHPKSPPSPSTPDQRLSFDPELVEARFSAPGITPDGCVTDGAAFQAQNPKPEIRTKSQGPNSSGQGPCPQPASDLDIRTFGLASDFGLRISDFTP